MRVIVLLTDLFDATGGIQTFNRALVKALDEIAAERGWKIAVLVLNDRGGNRLADRHFDSKTTQYRSFGRHKLRFVFSAFRHGLGASIIILGHVHFALLAMGLCLRRSKLKMFLNVYGVDVWRKLPKLQLLGVRRLDRILSISAATRDQMISHNDLAGKRFDILPCTLEPFYGRDASLSTRKELMLPSGKMILTVSRLNSSEHHKGIDKAIEALPFVLQEIPDVFCVVVGDGDDRSRLERIAKEAGVCEKVIFPGSVSNELLHSYYQACDVFVLPSMQEGFGIVFLEAMHYGKPCIGTRVGGIPEVIVDGKTGFLAEPGDIKTLTKNLVDLLRDDSLRYTLGQAGKERLAQKFSFDLFRRRLEKVLCG